MENIILEEIRDELKKNNKLLFEIFIILIDES